MANIHLVDVTMHLDESLEQDIRAKLEADLRALDGVKSIRSSKDAPHMLTVTYEEGHLKSKDVLKVILGDHLHAQIIG